MNNKTLTIECGGTFVGEITEEKVCEYKIDDSTTLAISVMQYPGSDERSLLLTSTKVYDADDQECIFLSPAQALELADNLTQIAKILIRSNNHVQEKQS